MKIFLFGFTLALFIGSFLAFGYAFTLEGFAAAALFTVGLLAAAFAFFIPFHLMEKAD